MTSQREIDQWAKDARAAGATHLIVVCDTFDHSDYPVRVVPPETVESARRRIEISGGSGIPNRIMEVIDLHDGPHRVDVGGYSYSLVVVHGLGNGKIKVSRRSLASSGLVGATRDAIELLLHEETDAIQGTVTDDHGNPCITFENDGHGFRSVGNAPRMGP